MSKVRYAISKKNAKEIRKAGLIRWSPVFSARRMRRYQAKMKAKEEVRNEKKEPVCKGASSPDVAPQKNPPEEGE